MTEAKRGTVLSLARGKDGKEGISPLFDALSEQGPPYEALRKSEERYRLLAENVSDLIFVMTLQLSFSYISPSVTRAVGFSPEEMLTISLESLLTPDSLELVTTTLMEEFALEENGGQRSFEGKDSPTGGKSERRLKDLAGKQDIFPQGPG